LLPPRAALLLPAPAFEPLPPLFLAPPFPALLFLALVFFAPPLVPCALLDPVDEAADDVAREAARVAVRVVFSAALAERFATRLAAVVSFLTSLRFSRAARFTASLTPLPEEPAPLDEPLEREEPLGRITSAAAGLTMPIMLAADSIMPVATLDAWSITSPVTSAAWFRAAPATSIVASTGPRPPRPFLLAIASLFLLLLPILFIALLHN
jgi:hypothetical protein